MGIKVGGHLARGEVRLSLCMKMPRGLGACSSLTWAQESGELSVPIHRLGTGTHSSSSENARASLGNENRRKRNEGRKYSGSTEI